jgi:aryl-alcohol dehydrogenase-like predicted oxidoreductase
MDYRRLGRTDIRVSTLCLGTMTWGEQNTEAEAHQQLDAAVAAGLNFIDTAEMYPVPPKAATYGRTEQYIGTWLKRRGARDKVILATKVVGRSESFGYVRDGRPRLDAKNITAALHDSLRRLQTEYVDLYQLHWPDRHTNYFGQLGYQPEPEAPDTVPIAETLEVLGDLVTAGKIRHVGLSNETPWGTMTFLNVAEQRGLPRVVSVQNPYNLLNRSFEVGLAEIAHREDTGLLAYSPLAFGTLTGKYLDGARPSGARLTLFTRFSRYTGAIGQAATRAYVDLARDHGLDPAQMALAYVTSRPFLTSNIIGATSPAQLQTDLDSVHVTLSAEVLQGIEAIHTRHPNPCP